MVDIPTKMDPEEEYFARQEIERKKKWAKENAEKMAADEKKRRQELHFMKCPKCGMDLQTIEYRGVKVDQCASCNGTWFDAGEIDLVLSQEHGFFGKMMGMFK